MAIGPGPEPPVAAALIGREREQATLREALAAALGGRGALVLIGGEAGIGKTALAEWLLTEATAQGALVLVGRCYDLAETPPYGLWREAFARAPSDDGLPTLPAAVLLPERDDGAMLADQDAVMRRVLAYLGTLATGRPLVLLLDDVHWADPVSLDLLRALARGLGEVPILVLVTYRSDELTRRHPLAPLLPLLVRESRAERVDLRPLDEAAIGALVAARYGLSAADTGRLAPYLAGRSEGNALFLGELLRTLEGEGVLHPAPLATSAVGAARGGDAWHLGDLDRVPVPTLLRQVIDGRLARLDGETQRLLAVAAIVGQVVPLDLWAAVGDATADTLLDHIERAGEARLLVETPDGRAVRFAHALFREALYEATPAIRRRAWHRRAGEAMEALPGPDPDAVAYHYRQAGDPRAVGWLVRASNRAYRAYAWLAAAERAEAALALLEQQGGDLAERGWLCARLARLLRMGDQRQALAYAERAAELATESGDAALAVQALGQLSLLRCRVGQVRAGLAAMEAHYEAQEALLPVARARLVARQAALGEPSSVGRPRDTLALWLALAGRYAEATTLAEQILDADPARREAVRNQSCFAHGVALADLGQPAASARWFAAAHALNRAAGEYWGLGQFTFVELLNRQVPYGADRPEECVQLAAEAEEAWRLASGAVRADAPPGLARLPLLALGGAWAAAWDVAQTVRAGGGANVPHVRAVIGPLALARGEFGLARELVRETLPGGPATEPGDCFFRTGVALQRVAAAMALDTGDLAGARAWLEAHDRWLAWNGAALGQAEGQLGWAAYRRAAGDLALARRHAEAALAHAAAPRQPLALLAAHRLLGELAGSAEHHAEAADQLAAAQALADACAAPYERALTLLALAELREGSSRPGDAAELLAEARAILVELGAAPALARADALAARLAAPSSDTAALPFGLTAREAAVLRLVAQGLTDPQIGERLFVSRHTVNAHLRGIYGKLGVNTRTAAARLAAEHGIV
jgi:DNA-binding CsgD family transcriptional regulator